MKPDRRLDGGADRTRHPGGPTAGIDRAWSPVWVTTVLGPLIGITADHLHARFLEVGEQVPGSPWWTRCPPSFAVATHEDPLVPALGLASRPWSGHPLRAFVAADSVALLHSHGVGDGRVSQALVADLLAPLGTPSRLAALRDARMWTIGSGAARLLWSAPGSVLRRWGGAGSGSAAGAGPATSFDFRVIERVVEGAALEEIRRRRRRLGTTVSMLLMSTLIDELAVAGVEVDLVAMATGIRRYLREGERYGGNLASVVHLAADGDATSRKQRVDAALDGGEPLLRYAAHRLLSGVLAGRTGRRLADPRTVLGWSDRGEAHEWAGLPWGHGPRRLVGGVAPPWGSRLGVHLTRLDGRLHVACTVNAACVDADRVEAALDATLRVSTEPRS